MTDSELIEKAKEILLRHGIRTVCLDMLKDTSGTDQERIDRLVCDTLYWEGRIL